MTENKSVLLRCATADGRSAATAYILVAIQLEERDLVSIHGHKYERYREEVPALVPFTKGRSAPDAASAA